MSRRRRTKEEVSQVEQIKRKINLEKRLKARAKRKRIFKRLIRMLILILVVISLYFIDKSNYSRIREIEVDGNEVISEEILLENLNLKENDRLIKALIKKYTLKNEALGVANQSLKLYYTKGLINLTVEEYPVVAIIEGKQKEYLLSNNHLIKSNQKISKSVPVLKNFNEKIFDDYPEFSDKLSKIDPSSFNSISEIQIIEEPLEDIYFKITMNHGYFVYSNLKNLLLMDYYPDIVSGIQQGDKKDNRCIYFLDYGHTDGNQSAVAKPCEQEE